MKISKREDKILPVFEENKTISRFNGKYEFLSNFYPSMFYFEGYRVSTAEHAFQMCKATNSLDKNKIASSSTPGIAKRHGRQITIRPDWEEVKIEKMREVLQVKFSKDEFKKSLIDTENAYLIEGNYWHDNFWGDCTCEKCADIPGENVLGHLLMELRDS